MRFGVKLRDCYRATHPTTTFIQLTVDLGQLTVPVGCVASKNPSPKNLQIHSDAPVREPSPNNPEIHSVQKLCFSKT